MRSKEVEERWWRQHRSRAGGGAIDRSMHCKRRCDSPISAIKAAWRTIWTNADRATQSGSTPNSPWPDLPFHLTSVVQLYKRWGGWSLEEQGRARPVAGRRSAIQLMHVSSFMWRVDDGRDPRSGQYRRRFPKESPRHHRKERPTPISEWFPLLAVHRLYLRDAQCGSGGPIIPDLMIKSPTGPTACISSGIIPSGHFITTPKGVIVTDLISADAAAWLNVEIKKLTDQPVRICAVFSA